MIWTARITLQVHIERRITAVSHDTIYLPTLYPGDALATLTPL